MTQPTNPPAPEVPEPGAAQPADPPGPEPPEPGAAQPAGPLVPEAPEPAAAVTAEPSDTGAPPAAQASGTPDELPGAGASGGQQALAAQGSRRTEQAPLPIGLGTGVLGVLLTIGFVFLPVSTLAEKLYVLFACLALAVASVTGIGAWQSGRRFALTAFAAGVAVVCLVMNNISSQPGPARHSP